MLLGLSNKIATTYTIIMMLFFVRLFVISTLDILIES